MGRSFHPGELIPTPDFSFERDNAGLWSGHQKYHCKREELERLIPPKGAPHYLFSFLGVDKVRIVGFEEKLVVLSVTYAGFQASNDDGSTDEAEYTLTLSTSEEPIATHPRYDDLSNFDVNEAVELARNPPKSQDGKKTLEVDQTGWAALKTELYGDTQKGLESYREPRVTWTKRWVSDSRPQDLNRIGEIDTPEGNPPPVAAGRNWLNTGLTIRERGEVFENELTWELSGRGGWDSRYYSD